MGNHVPRTARRRYRDEALIMGNSLEEIRFIESIREFVRTHPEKIQSVIGAVLDGLVSELTEARKAERSWEMIAISAMQLAQSKLDLKQKQWAKDLIDSKIAELGVRATADWSQSKLVEERDAAVEKLTHVSRMLKQMYSTPVTITPEFLDRIGLD